MFQRDVTISLPRDGIGGGKELLVGKNLAILVVAVDGLARHVHGVRGEGAVNTMRQVLSVCFVAATEGHQGRANTMARGGEQSQLRLRYAESPSFTQILCCGL